MGIQDLVRHSPLQEPYSAGHMPSVEHWPPTCPSLSTAQIPRPLRFSPVRWPCDRVALLEIEQIRYGSLAELFPIAKDMLCSAFPSPSAGNAADGIRAFHSFVT